MTQRIGPKPQIEGRPATATGLGLSRFGDHRIPFQKPIGQGNHGKGRQAGITGDNACGPSQG